MLYSSVYIAGCSQWLTKPTLPMQGVVSGMSRSISQNKVGDLFIPSTPAKETHDLVVFEDQQGAEGAPSGISSSAWAFIQDNPLETCYDLLCDNLTFQVAIRSQREAVV